MTLFLTLNFLRSYVLSRSATREATFEATRIYQFVTNNQASFHLRWNEKLVKHQEFSKYYYHGCRCSNPVTLLFWLKVSCRMLACLISIALLCWLKVYSHVFAFYLQEVLLTEILLCGVRPQNSVPIPSTTRNRNLQKRFYRSKRFKKISNRSHRTLTPSWWRPLSYTNQSIDLRSKLMDWFLYDNGLRHERVKKGRNFSRIRSLDFEFLADFLNPIQDEVGGGNKKVPL